MVATSQNTDAESYAGPFMDGLYHQGLMGLAFPELAVGRDTVVNAWYQDGAISKYAIAFHGCSPELTSNGWIDFGNDTAYQNPYPSCKSGPQLVNMPKDGSGFYNLDIQGFSVQGKSISLPEPWQDSMFSILDSCTTQIFLPARVFTTIQSAILKSGAFSKALASDPNLERYFDGLSNIAIPYELYSSSDISWSKLPTLSVTIYTHVTPSSTITLTLSASQYLMFVPDYGWSFFLTSSNESFGILGYPFFASFYIVADLSGNTLTFQPGCGCNSSAPGGVGVSISSANVNSNTRKTVSSSIGNYSPTMHVYVVMFLLFIAS